MAKKSVPQKKPGKRSRLPVEQSLWHRLSRFQTIMQRDAAIYKISLHIDKGYDTLKSRLFRNTGSDIKGGPLAAMALATGTDTMDWLNPAMYMVPNGTGGYIFLTEDDAAAHVEALNALRGGTREREMMEAAQVAELR